MKTIYGFKIIQGIFPFSVATPINTIPLRIKSDTSNQCSIANLNLAIPCHWLGILGYPEYLSSDKV